jgi:hypothetical protein
MLAYADGCETEAIEAGILLVAGVYASIMEADPSIAPTMRRSLFSVVAVALTVAF